MIFQCCIFVYGSFWLFSPSTIIFYKLSSSILIQKSVSLFICPLLSLSLSLSLSDCALKGNQPKGTSSSLPIDAGNIDIPQGHVGWSTLASHVVKPCIAIATLIKFHSPIHVWWTRTREFYPRSNEEDGNTTKREIGKVMLNWAELWISRAKFEIWNTIIWCWQNLSISSYR